MPARPGRTHKPRRAPLPGRPAQVVEQTQRRPDAKPPHQCGSTYINTPLLDILPAEAKEQLVALHPIGRLGRAEKVAELVIWLDLETVSFVTGGSEKLQADIQKVAR